MIDDEAIEFIAPVHAAAAVVVVAYSATMATGRSS